MNVKADLKPVDILREAIKQLTARKLPPTPAHYAAVYHEIAGVADVPPFPSQALQQIMHALPGTSPHHKMYRVLFERAIAQSDWDGVQRALVGYVSAESPKAAGAPVVPADAVPAPPAGAAILEAVARLIENTLPALGNEDARLVKQVDELIAAMRTPACDMATVKSMLGNVSHRLSFVAEDQAEIKAMLVRLLQMIIENMSELALDDNYLKRQTEPLMAAATPPLTLRRLDELERRLKDVIFKQIDAKGRTLQAQALMREMLAMFLERLAHMTESTSTYHAKLEESARLMERAKSLEEFAPVLKDVITATRGMATDMARSRDELQTMREKAQTAQADITRLNQELATVNAQARHDVLTGALNRKGLDEAMTREIATVRRKQTPLCFALLDIDNFKKLNDTKGHATGDAALAHLATVTRECMRAQDSIARYGGEEFVILMPDTTLENGIVAMTRLQRALTRQFFLADSEQILITFSAGVAQLLEDEPGDEAIKRADQAMYLAKRAGKNRVVGA